MNSKRENVKLYKVFSVYHESIDRTCLKYNVTPFSNIELWIYIQLNEDIAGFNLPITM